MTTETPDELQIDSVQSIDSEVQLLYEKHYQISLLYGKSRIKIDPEYPLEAARALEEKVYQNARKTPSFRAGMQSADAVGVLVVNPSILD